MANAVVFKMFSAIIVCILKNQLKLLTLIDKLNYLLLNYWSAFVGNN